MDPAYQSSSYLPLSTNKVQLQREYREKEQASFNKLRDILKDLTGKELRTRHEILSKATEVLSLEHRKLEEAQVSALNAYGAHSGPTTNYVHDSTHHTMSNSIQLADWYSSADFDPAMLNDGTLIHDEQYNIPDMDWSNHQY